MACFGVTEPDAGLDATIEATGQRVGDRYVIDGQKTWISTAQVAHKAFILARTTPLDRIRLKTDGLSLFYTDLDRSRVEVRVIHKMGRHAVELNQVFFDGLEVPVRDLIGDENDGFRLILHHELDQKQILIASEAIGLGRAALSRASATLASGWSSAGRSVRTRASSTRWRAAG